MTEDEQLALDLALLKLPDRLRLVVEMRFLTEPSLTLRQVGQRLGVSPQRVSQLQATALWRLGWEMRRLSVWEPHVLETEWKRLIEGGRHGEPTLRR